MRAHSKYEYIMIYDVKYPIDESRRHDFERIQLICTKWYIILLYVCRLRSVVDAAAVRLLAITNYMPSTNK